MESDKTNKYDALDVESSDPTMSDEEKQAQRDNMVFLQLAAERYVSWVEYYGDNKNKMIEDLEFLEGDGNQWPENIKADRAADRRPTLEINKLPRFLDQLVGDERQNRPQIKIRPANSVANKDTAKVMNGLMRNIQVISDSNVAYDHAFEHCGAAGLGFIRVATGWVDNKSFDQEILIKKVGNALAIAWDPDATEADLKDAKWMMVIGKMKRSLYVAKYPNSSMCGWNTEDSEMWAGKDYVIVAEYFVKTPKTSVLYEVMRDGRAIATNTLADGEIPIRKRVVSTDKVKWYKITQRDVLEKKDWPGKYIPLVPVFGKELNINGRIVHRGIVRHAKDPVRLYNYSRSAGAEAVSLAPKAPYLMTPEQLKGHKAQWDLANTKNFPYLLYNYDSNAPGGMPKRESPAQVSTGILSEIQISATELPETIGLPEANLGDKTNEKSGKAIIARQNKGAIGNFAYLDNLARALVHVGRICVDIMPIIYDTDERIERILGEDGTEESITLNTKDNDGKPLHDVRIGRYDVVSTVGPSYATKQEEAADGMIAFLGVYPDAAPVIGDLVAGEQAWPGADKISKRLKKLVPQQVLEPEELKELQDDEAKKAANNPQPQQQAPQGPGPEEMAATETMLELKIEMEEVKLAQEKAELRKKEAEAAKAELELKREQAGLNTQQE